MEQEILSEIDKLSQKFSTDQETLQEAQHIITDTIMRIGEIAEQRDLISRLELSNSSDLIALRKLIREFHAKGKQVAQSVRSNIVEAV